VQESLKGILLQYAGEAYRGKIGKGLSLILNGILAQIIVGVLSFVAILALGQGSGVMVGVAVASLAVTVALIAGYWLYTEPDPGYTGLEKQNSSRQVARAAVIASAVVQAAQLAIDVLAPWATSSAGMQNASPGQVALIGVYALLSLAGLAAWATQFFAVMLHTRWLGSRIPDRAIVAQSKRYMWLLPVLTTVGLILLGLGPLIALILYWNLLNRLRKHVRSIERTGAPDPQIAGV